MMKQPPYEDENPCSGEAGLRFLYVFTTAWSRPMELIPHTVFRQIAPGGFPLRDRVFEFCKIFARSICISHLLQLELGALLILGAFQVLMLLIL